MLKQIGKLVIHKSADYYNYIAKALEEDGYTLILECETTTDRHYIIAEEDKDI